MHHLADAVDQVKTYCNALARLNGLIRHGSKAKASRFPMAAVVASLLITFEVSRVMQSALGMYIIPVFDVGRAGVCRSERLGQGRSEDVRQNLNLASIRTLVQPPQPHDVNEKYATRLPHRLQSGKRILSRCLVLCGRNETIETRTSAGFDRRQLHDWGNHPHLRHDRNASYRMFSTSYTDLRSKLYCCY